MPTKADNPAGLSRRASRAALSTFLLLVCVYLLTAKGFTEITDAESYYMLTEALVQRGVVYVDPDERLSAKVGTYPGRGGHQYVQYWIGYPLLLVPFYAVGQAAAEVGESLSPRLASVGRVIPRAVVNTAPVFVTAAQGALLVLMVALLLGSVRTALATGLLYGLATVAWPYAKIGFYESAMGLATLFVVYCLLVYAYRRPAWWWPLLAGLALGWAVAARPTVALMLPGVAVWLAHVRLRPRPEQVGLRSGGWRPVALALVGFLPWVAVILWYNWARSGDPLDPGYPAVNWALSAAGGGFWQQLPAYLFGSGRGLFVFAPVALLAVAGWPVMHRTHRAEAWLALLIFLAYWLFHAARIAPDPWGWGPRFLIPSLAVVMLPAAWGLRRLWPRRGGRALVIALVAAGLAVQLLSVLVSYGAWFHAVHGQTQTSASVAFDWRYWPLAGQVHTLRHLDTGALNLEGSGLRDSFVSEEFKHRVRYGLDLWWVHARRLGLPRLLIWPLLGLLLLGAGLSLRQLLRAWRSG